MGLGVQQLEDLDACVEVELARRLKSARRIGFPLAEGSGDRDALLLATGQLMGEMRGAVCQTDPIEHLTGERASTCAPGDVGSELDILKRGEGGEKVERLKDETDAPAAEREQLLARQPSDVPARYNDPPLARRSSAPMMFSSVVLPLPDGPSTTTKSSAATRMETSASATTTFVPTA